MGAKSRREASMPIDNDGRLQRCYTNQSESINNMLTRQTEAVTGKVKRGNQTKLEFVRDSWFAILANQEHEIQLALCGQSEDLQLTEQARYLEVDVGVLWFDWSPKQRLRVHKEIWRTDSARCLCWKGDQSFCHGRRWWLSTVFIWPATRVSELSKTQRRSCKGHLYWVCQIAAVPDSCTAETLSWRWKGEIPCCCKAMPEGNVWVHHQ